MSDFILALISILSGLSAATAFGMAFQSHWHLLSGQHAPQPVDQAEPGE